MFRILIVLSVLLSAGIVTAGEKDNQKDVLRRLMEEPVTLFDWGIAQLDKDIAQSAGRTIPTYVGKPVTGSFYDWHANRITLFVSVAVPKESRTSQACAATFNELVADLTRNTPKGPSAAGWYLLNAFKPKAHFWADRFEDVGAKLLDLVRLEVTFIPATFEAFDGVQRRVSCHGRLDAEAADLIVEVTS